MRQTSFFAREVPARSNDAEELITPGWKAGHPPELATYALGVGISFESPHWKALKPAVDLIKYQTPVDGLNTAISDFPSPS